MDTVMLTNTHKKNKTIALPKQSQLIWNTLLAMPKAYISQMESSVQGVYDSRDHMKVGWKH